MTTSIYADLTNTALRARSRMAANAVTYQTDKLRLLYPEFDQSVLERRAIEAEILDRKRRSHSRCYMSDRRADFVEMRLASMGPEEIQLENDAQTMADIFEVVGARHGFHVDELMSYRSIKPLAHGRQEAWWVMRERRSKSGGAKWSLPQIGQKYGRDQSTIRHGVLSYEERTELAWAA